MSNHDEHQPTLAYDAVELVDGRIFENDEGDFEIELLPSTARLGSYKGEIVDVVCSCGEKFESKQQMIDHFEEESGS